MKVSYCMLFRTILECPACKYHCSIAISYIKEVLHMYGIVIIMFNVGYQVVPFSTTIL